MLYALVVILLILWLIGWLGVKVAGNFIHLVLLIAAIVLLVQLFQGRRAI